MKRDHSDIVKVGWARPRANSDRLPPGPKRRTDWADVLSEQHALSEPAMVPRSAGYPPLAASPLLPPTPVRSWAHVNAMDLFEQSSDKYLRRWRVSGNIDDLKLAVHYFNNIIELQTQQPESK